MQGWQSFYEMIGGAAATLLGLLFVSVSMNAEIILGQRASAVPAACGAAFQNYLAVLVVGLMVCLPGNGHQVLGYTLLSVSAVWSAWALYRLISTLRAPIIGDTRRNVLRRYLATITGFGLIAYAAFDLAVDTRAQTTIYIAVGSMLLLVSATIASWELLTKVAQDKYRAQK
ncbi:MAG: hypothetical protein WDM89_07400 [Rhizomicrobium sp.]